MSQQPRRAVARRVGRPNLIDRPAIADAAIRLVAEEGADALTLQNVAARLGVKYPALYRYVDGRDELLRLVADRFMSTTPWPEPHDDDWRGYLRAVAAAIDELCGRYPGMLDLIYNQVWPLPRELVLAWLRMAQHLVDLGFPKDLAWVSSDLVADLAAETRIRRDRVAARPGAQLGFTAALTDEDVSADRAALDDEFTDGGDGWASAKIEIVLDGIEIQLRRRLGRVTEDVPETDSDTV